MADAMHEAMLDARHEGGSYRRIEVITGQRRRRQWTAEEKARIVAEKRYSRTLTAATSSCSAASARTE